MVSTSEQIVRTYNSFSGADMVATFGGVIIGELQGLSFTVQREKVPLYTMGSASPRGFSRGKRGIAGSLIFLVFDRSALLDVLSDKPRFYYLGNLTEVDAEHAKGGEITIQGFDETVGTGSVGRPTTTVNTITLQKTWAKAKFLDQVPPFNIVINAANEYGSYAKMEILGVEILNQGSGMSVDDITTDEACTFVAQDIKFWNGQGTLARPK